MRVIRYQALFLLFCAGLAAQTANFAGVAINSVTGEPLSGVHLKLFILNITGGVMDSYGALSGRDGRFSVTGVPPGTYVMLVERTGFVHMMTPSGSIPLSTVTLKSGDRITDYKLAMTPRAMLAVRVVDEYGDAMPYVNVEIAPTSPEGPVVASFSSMNRSAMANVLGECRITLGPGKYLVKATPNQQQTNQAPEIRSDGTSEATYGATWYPSATSADRGTPVALEAGGDVAVEVRLVRQRSLSIRGVVTGIPQGATATVTLASGDRADRLRSTRSNNAAPDGKFSFSKLPPAFYRLTAVVTGSRPSLQSQAVEVKPDGPESVDVQLALAAAADITGTVAVAGDPPGSPVEKRTVTLSGNGFSMGSETATTEPDGSFRIGGVFPGQYHVDITSMPENGYAKLEVDGVTARDLFVDLAAGSKLKITIARDGAQLSGTVLDKDGQPLGQTVAVVVLASDPEHISPTPDGIVKEGGKYSLKGIRPGKYLVFAVDAFRSGSLHGEEDLKKAAAAAEEIEIKAGEKITKDLKVLLKEDLDARTKK